MPPVEVEQSKDGPTASEADDDDDDEDGAGGAVVSGTGVLVSVNFALASTNFFWEEYFRVQLLSLHQLL